MLKKISLIVALLVAGNVHAQSIVNDLIGVGIKAEQAEELEKAFNTAIPADARFLAGKTVSLQEATAASKCMGTLTCNGASDVVTSTTCATTGSRIFLTRTSLDADTTGDAYVKSISNGVSFTVACELNDTGTLNWIIFHEAP